jgi:hypothetical protein
MKKNLWLAPYHNSQYGFRRGRSTVHAIMRVTKFADLSRKANKKLQFDGNRYKKCVQTEAIIK